MENVAIDSTSNAWNLQDDLVWAILVRVPIKPLMQFKLVSKLWNSIIRNLDFAKNHSFHNDCFRGIIMTDSIYSMSCQNGLYRVFYANLNANDFKNGTNLKYYEHATWDSRHFEKVTSIVKGLIGLYDYDGFTLCNISTQEMVKLPKGDHGFNEEHYLLGFDPVKDVYKILKSYIISRVLSFCSRKTQIFTVGRDSDLTWGDIDLVPFEYESRSLCINGTMYWLITKSLIAFDLNSERYETIPLPDNRREVRYHLADIGGSAAIVGQDSSRNPFLSYDYCIDIWMMEKDDRGKFQGWTRKSYRLPQTYRLSRNWFVCAGTLPTGQMLLARPNSEEKDARENIIEVSNIHIFKYDHIKNEMSFIKLDDPPESQKEGVVNLVRSVEICYHEENIIPLAPLLIKQNQQ